eukprot:6665042-Prymnesium_polylepis.1
MQERSPGKLPPAQGVVLNSVATNSVQLRISSVCSFRRQYPRFKSRVASVVLSAQIASSKQSSQSCTADSTVGLKKPAEHTGQVAVPPREPAGGTQASHLFLPLSGCAVPAGHNTQDDDPGSSLMLPGGHGVHSAFAKYALCLPLGHGRHWYGASASVSSSMPAGQPSVRMSTGGFETPPFQRTSLYDCCAVAHVA